MLAVNYFKLALLHSLVKHVIIEGSFYPASVQLLLLFVFSKGDRVHGAVLPKCNRFPFSFHPGMGGHAMRSLPTPPAEKAHQSYPSGIISEVVAFKCSC